MYYDDYECRRIRTPVISSSYVTALGSSPLTPLQQKDIEEQISSSRSSLLFESFPQLKPQVRDILAGKVSDNLIKSIFENGRIRLENGRFAGKEARIQIRVVELGTTGFNRVGNRPLYSYLNYDEIPGQQEVILNLNITKGFILSTQSNPHILAQLILQSLSPEVLGLNYTESLLSLSPFNNSSSPYKFLNNLIEFMLMDAAKDKDLDYLKSILGKEYRLKEETRQILIVRNRWDLIANLPGFSAEIKLLIKNSIRTIELGFDPSAENLAEHKSPKLVQLIYETAPERWKSVLGPIINKDISGFNGKVKRGISDEEAKILYEKNPEKAEELGVILLGQEKQPTGFGYAHSLKHRKEIENYGFDFDNVLFATLSNPDLKITTVRDPTLPRYMYVTYYIRDPQGKADTWLIAITDQKTDELITFFSALTNPPKNKSNKSLSMQFEILTHKKVGTDRYCLAFY
ncbi:MAG: hypothetical protein ACK4NT_02515, partial [Candidatus Omnitrophota bacterium]